MKYSIQQCEESDAEFIWERGFETVPTDDNAKQEIIVIKVTDENGDVIGGCVIDIDETKMAEFDRLWVDKLYRRRGIGSALIREAERVALEKGCRTLVNTYNFDFQPARKLFEQLGYKLIGTIQDWPKGHECYSLIKRFDNRISIGPSDTMVCRNGFNIELGSEEDGEFITEMLEANNRLFAPRSHEYLNIDKKLLDEEGIMIAGCVAGVSGWDTLHIDVLWVDEPYYNEGLGSYLLGEIEAEARKNGAYISIASLPESQADFFKKHGYTACVLFKEQPEWCMLSKHL